ncbi:MAG: PEP-CTERM sorting domain-containing protein [Oscillatoriales cyanobacterium]|nr:MAG: PEP-CTERM sorting domain-containing protein [Oscillatoriales cyanobacterium]
MRAIDGAEPVPEPSEIGGIVTAAAIFGGLLWKRKRSDRKVQVK